MRTTQYDEGYRRGVKECAAWLYRHAQTMNDPWAKAVLNVAADSLGKHGKDYTLEAKAKMLEVVLARAASMKETT